MPQDLTKEALAKLGYICSACLERADKCRCPYEERRGIEVKPPLVIYASASHHG